MTVQGSRKNLALVLGQTNPEALRVRVSTTGEVIVGANGPNGEVVTVNLEPPFSSGNRQYDLLQYAPKAWWRGSKSLLSAIDRGLIEVEAAAGDLVGMVPLSTDRPTVVSAIQIASGREVSSTGWAVLGGIVADLQNYDSAVFAVAGNVNASGLVLAVQLYNLTQRFPVATLSFNETSPTIATADIVPVPSGESIFEVRGRLVELTDPNVDLGLILSASVKTRKKV